MGKATAAKTEAPKVDETEIDLAELMNEITDSLRAAAPSGAIQYIKNGEYILKLVKLPGQPIFQPVQTFYKGKPGTAFITPAIIVGCTDAESINPNAVRYVQLTAGLVRDIKAQVASEWNFWTAEAACIKVTKALIKGKTEYGLAVMAKKVFNDSQAARPEISIVDAAEAENQRNVERNEAEGNTAPAGEDLK